MSEIMDLDSYPPVYKDAKLIIEELVRYEVIKPHASEEEYLKIWDAALAISKQIKRQPLEISG